MISKFELVQEGGFRRIKYLVDFWLVDRHGFSTKIAAGTLGGLVSSKVELSGEDWFIDEGSVIEGLCKISGNVRIFDSQIKAIGFEDVNYIRGNVVINNSVIHAGSMFVHCDNTDTHIRISKSVINTTNDMCMDGTVSVHDSDINCAVLDLNGDSAVIGESSVTTKFVLSVLDGSCIVGTKMNVTSINIRDGASINNSVIDSKRTRFELSQDSSINQWVCTDLNRSAEDTGTSSIDAIRLSGQMRITNGDVISKPVIGVRFENHYYVTITDSHIRIGCQRHTVDEWENFKLMGEIVAMDGRNAMIFWQTYGDIIIAMYNARKKEPAVIAQYNEPEQYYYDLRYGARAAGEINLGNVGQ